MMFCLRGQTIHTFTCLIATTCKAVDRCQTTFLFQGEFQPWEDFASLSSRSGRAFPSPRLNTSFRRTCSLSIYETTSMGNRHQLYKPLQVRLISHRTSSLLATCQNLTVLSLLTSWGAVIHHTMCAAKCLVSLVVVLVAAVCATHAQEKIKMCGRELIRLAVSSCGNSHLRRSIPDVELDQHHDTSHCKYCQTSVTVGTFRDRLQILIFFLCHIWYIINLFRFINYPVNKLQVIFPDV